MEKALMLLEFQSSLSTKSVFPELKCVASSNHVIIICEEATCCINSGEKISFTDL